MTSEQASQIKELQEDLGNLEKWKKEYKKEHDISDMKKFFEFKNPQEWMQAEKEYLKDKKVIKFHEEYEKKWNELRRKYKVNDHGDIFDTSIWGFDWMTDSSVEINGYLNEDNFVLWLETVVKANNLRLYSHN